jgi:hypothetical protein
MGNQAKWIVWKRWIAGGKILMILIIKIVVQTVVYAVIAGIMVNNNISMKSKSYWSVMALTAFLYVFGFVMGKAYMVG